MQEIIEMVASVGFPIAVTCYLLYERNTAIKELTKVISELTIYLRGRGGTT